MIEEDGFDEGLASLPFSSFEMKLTLWGPAGGWYSGPQSAVYRQRMMMIIYNFRLFRTYFMGYLLISRGHILTKKIYKIVNGEKKIGIVN